MRPKNAEHPPLSKCEAFESVSEMSHVSQRGKMIGLLITMFKLVSAACSGGSAPPPALTLAAFPGKLLKDKSPGGVKCFKPRGVGLVGLLGFTPTKCLSLDLSGCH